jgi:hypothetical protein
LIPLKSVADASSCGAGVSATAGAQAPTNRARMNRVLNNSVFFITVISFRVFL